MSEVLTANDVFLNKMAAAAPTKMGSSVRQQIKSARAHAHRSCPLPVKFIAALNGVISEVSRMCTLPANTMCKNYGHIQPETWFGDFPKCTECGAVIKSIRELRRASADVPTPEKRSVWVYNTSGHLVLRKFE